MVGAPAGDPQGAALNLPTGAPGRRRWYLAAALLTIVVGLAVHRGLVPLPPRLRDATGDALWAGMIVWWLGAAWPAWRPMPRAAGAFAICVTVECSQLVHTPWLDALRATTVGHLVLGSGFDIRDLPAYAVGCVLALLVDGWRASRVGTDGHA